jgi:peroxiredoxin
MRKTKMKFLFICSLLLTVTTGLFAQNPAGLQVNDKAPVFTAKNQNGKKISLAGLLKKGPVVLVFYRGFWCPFCNKHLKQLEDSLSLITGRGATLLTVTPEKQESIAKTLGKVKATYPVLHDAGLKIMKAYDVSFALDSATITRYRGYGINLEESNGANGANLPVPAVYIIRPDGKIGWRYFDKNYTKRPSVKEILENL